MFGEKQRRIEELERELTELQPWVDNARLIRDRTLEFAATTDLQTAINLAVQTAGEEERQGFAREAFRQLDPEQQLTVLSDVFGDGIFKEALEEERQRRIRLLDKDACLEHLFQEAKEHKRVIFSQIPEDSKVEIYLYNHNTLDDHAPRKLNWWVRRIKGVMNHSGQLIVQHDDRSEERTYAGGNYSRYSDFTTVSLDRTSTAGEAEPSYFGISIRLPGIGNNDVPMNADLGPVFVDGKEIFGAIPASHIFER